jgi:hypothetical protein
MKNQLKKCLPKECFLFAFIISFVLLFLPFHSSAEEKSDYEIQASLQRFVNRAVHLTEEAVDVEKHTRHWPKPEFRNKWSKRTYEMHSVNLILIRGRSLGLRESEPRAHLIPKKGHFPHST